MSDSQVPEPNSASHNCPAECPNRAKPTQVQNFGLLIVTIALTLFTGAWVARGYFERKSPSVWEIGFAVACIYLALTDPKAARSLSARTIGHFLAVDVNSLQEPSDSQ